MMGLQVHEEDKGMKEVECVKAGGMRARGTVGSEVESIWVWFLCWYQLVLGAVAGDELERGGRKHNQGPQCCLKEFTL